MISMIDKTEQPLSHRITERLGPDRIQHDAEAAGLRVAEAEPNRRGWLKCHAFDREDRNPSAGLNVENGVYNDFAGGSCDFFELLAHLGRFPNREAAIQHYADELGFKLRGRKSRRRRPANAAKSPMTDASLQAKAEKVARLLNSGPVRVEHVTRDKNGGIVLIKKYENEDGRTWRVETVHRQYIENDEICNLTMSVGPQVTEYIIQTADQYERKMFQYRNQHLWYSGSRPLRRPRPLEKYPCRSVEEFGKVLEYIADNGLLTLDRPRWSEVFEALKIRHVERIGHRLRIEYDFDFGNGETEPASSIVPLKAFRDYDTLLGVFPGRTENCIADINLPGHHHPVMTEPPILLEDVVRAIREYLRIIESEEHDATCTCESCQDTVSQVVHRKAAVVSRRPGAGRLIEQGIDPDYDLQGTCTIGGTLFHPDSGKIRHLMLACRCWKCPACRQRLLIPEWLEHIRGLFRSKDAFRHRIFRGEIKHDDFEAARKQISRAGGGYVRVRITDERTVIYSNKRFRGSKAVRASVADKRIARDLDSIQNFSRPVSTSRGWAIRREASKKWIRISESVKFDREAYLRAAKERSLEAYDLSSRGFGTHTAIRGGLQIETPKTPKWTLAVALKFVSQVEGPCPSISIELPPVESNPDTGKPSEPLTLVLGESPPPP